MSYFARKLPSNLTKLGLHLILGPHDVTQPICSIVNMNSSTRCDNCLLARLKRGLGASQRGKGGLSHKVSAS